MMRSVVNRLATFALTVLAGASVSSCFAVTDLDRFHAANASTSNFVDLRLTVRGMVSHVTELFEYRVVDSTNLIQSRGFALPLGNKDATFFIPGAIPRQNGPFRLDFYADHNGSAGYDSTRTENLDHSWRLPLDENATDETGAVNVVFDHNTSFTFLADPPPSEVGKGATVHFANMGAFDRRRLQVRIADASSNRVVALYRMPTMVAPSFDVAVPGMIEAGVTYSVEVYTDDGIGGGVHAFRVERLSTAEGLEFTFDPMTAGPEVTDVPPP